MNLLFIAIFWIKLLSKLSKFLTIQKRDGQFSVVGFTGMLKPNIFRALITRGGGRSAFYG
jgi:hypothetical protein